MSQGVAAICKENHQTIEHSQDYTQRYIYIHVYLLHFKGFKDKYINTAA